MARKREYDYVICGSSPAGCVLAGELLKNTDASVCIIEAGSGSLNTKNHVIGIGVGYANVFNDLWKYKDRKKNIPLWSAKILGGGSSINGMIYVPPSKEDIVQGLGDEFLVYDKFLRMIEQELGINKPTAPHLYSKILMSQLFADQNTRNKLDYLEKYEDFSGIKEYKNCVVNVLKTFDSNGRRINAFNIYAKPYIAQLRLDIMPNTVVDRFTIKNDVVKEVITSRGDVITARKAFVLSAGTLQSPSILMRSGYGNETLLKSLGIDVVSNNCEVGKNLQDHSRVEFNYFAPEVLTSADFTLPVHSTLFIKDNCQADLFMPNAKDVLNGVKWKVKNIPKLIKYLFSEENGFFKSRNGNIVSLALAICTPRSRGNVVIQNKDPLQFPSISSGIHSESEDFNDIVNGAKYFIDQMKMSDDFAKLIPLFNPKKIAQYVRKETTTHWHYVGTCAVDKVVDKNFKVIGIDNLYIADLSVIKRIPKNHTQSFSYFIGKIMSEKLLNQKT